MTSRTMAPSQILGSIWRNEVDGCFYQVRRSRPLFPGARRHVPSEAARIINRKDKLGYDRLGTELVAIENPNIYVPVTDPAEIALQQEWFASAERQWSDDIRMKRIPKRTETWGCKTPKNGEK